MGFLDNLFKKEAKKFITNMVDNAVDNVSEKIAGKKNGTRLTGEAGLRARLEEVFAGEYGSYEIRKNVPATEMGADHGAVDYSYGMYKNGAPVAFINVIQDRNDYSKKRFRMAKQAAENSNIPHMNFFSHLPNEVNYISERLKREIFR